MFCFLLLTEDVVILLNLLCLVQLKQYQNIGKNVLNKVFAGERCFSKCVECDYFLQKLLNFIVVCSY